MCAPTWIHQRVPMVGGLLVANGITISDMTSQITGPYTAATAKAPPGVRMASRRAAHVRAARMNNDAQVSATAK